MPLTLPSSFSNHSIKQNWLVQLYNSDHVEGVTTSAFIGLSFYHAELDSNEYYPFINNKPSIRESINLKNQTSSTSNVSLTCSNDKIFKNSFLSLSEHLHGQSIKYLNRAVKIYIQPNDSTSISDCLLIYTGKLVDISHDLSQVYLSITAKRPWDGVEIPQKKTSRNNYFPIAYGDYRPNASTSNADSVAISVGTSSSSDEFRLRKTLYPIPVEEVQGNTVFSLTGDWSQSAKAWPHFYEKNLDKFLPLANHASTATTVDSANETFGDGYAIRFHKNLLKTFLLKPNGYIGETGGTFADNANAIDGTTVDTSTFTLFDDDPLPVSDNNVPGSISYNLPQVSGIPTKLQFYIVVQGDCDFTKTAGSGDINIEFQNFTFGNEDVLGHFPFTVSTSNASVVTTGSGGVNISSPAIISGNNDISSNYLSSSDGWGADCVIRIKEDVESGNLEGTYNLDFKLYDIVIETSTKLDFSTSTTKSESAKFINDLEFVYSGGDGYPDNGWNSNSAITEIHEAHRDLLHRFTSYDNSNTPVNWSSGTNINSIKDWKIRYWLNEPRMLKDVLEELQFNGQFIFRFNGQDEGVYVFIPDSISTDHTLKTNDLENISISLTPVSEIVARMDIELEKHPATGGYLTEVSASNSTTESDLGISSLATENKRTIRLDALVSSPATTPQSNPNDDFYTYVNNIYGEQKIEVEANIINPSLYGIDVGDFVAFDNNDMPIAPFGDAWTNKDFIVVEISRTLGKLSCKFREV
jgi:hypothetical protein